MQHYETAPEDRIPIPHRLIYGLGAFVNNLLGFAIGSIVGAGIAAIYNSLSSLRKFGE